MPNFNPLARGFLILGHKQKNDMLGKFDFKKVSSGAYQVTYTTYRGDYYVSRVEDMPLIDATLHASSPLAKDVDALRLYVANHGTHFHKDGRQFRDQPLRFVNFRY